MRNRQRKGWRRYVNAVNIATVVTILFVIIPLYWMISSSFKGQAGIGTTSLIPHDVTTSNYNNNGLLCGGWRHI